MENSPTRAEQVTDESIKAAVDAIKESEQEKWRQCWEMVDELEPAQVEHIRKAKKR